jgi:hypothetical protein
MKLKKEFPIIYTGCVLCKVRTEAKETFVCPALKRIEYAV